MATTIEQRTKNKVKEFRADVDQLEEYVKRWEQDIRLKEIGRASEKCYEAFNDLQMNLSKLVDKTFGDRIQLSCYEDTRKFLSYFESEANEDVVVLLFNHCKPFTQLFTHCSDYCSKIEREYNIPLDSEEAIKANKELTQHLKSLRGI